MCVLLTHSVDEIRSSELGASGSWCAAAPAIGRWWFSGSHLLAVEKENNHLSMALIILRMEAERSCCSGPQKLRGRILTRVMPLTESSQILQLVRRNDNKIIMIIIINYVEEEEEVEYDYRVGSSSARLPGNSWTTIPSILLPENSSVRWRDAWMNLNLTLWFNSLLRPVQRVPLTNVRKRDYQQIIHCKRTEFLNDWHVNWPNDSNDQVDWDEEDFNGAAHRFTGRGTA